MNQHYEASQHRHDETSLTDIQKGNAAWWTQHTMSYDWKSRVSFEKFSHEWYEEIDRRFIHDSRLFAHDKSPFDLLIPFDALRDKKVLEIGCGMGFHTELFSRAGAEVTSIDISPVSVEATQNRLRLKNLRADVLLQDAESLPFVEDSFDFVWSWGVIHHSSRTATIVREISRVLRPEGSCAAMVYNRQGASAWRAFIKYHLLLGGFVRSRSVDEALNRGTDGFHARHYPQDQFEDLFRAFFKDVESRICGQVPDALPLPRRLRNAVERFFSEAWMKRAQSKRGSFIFLNASHPT